MEDMNNELNTCFLLSHVPNPRMNKRIDVLKNYGNTNVICIRRKNQDIWEPFHGDVKHFIFDLDLPGSSHPMKRWFALRGYRRQAWRLLNEINPNLIYTAGLDSLMLAKRYRERHGIRMFYEVSDLREIYVEPPKGLVKRLIAHIIKRIERAAVKRADLLIVTSPKFYDLYYGKFVKPEKVVFIANAPDEKAFQGYRHKAGGEFTVGFIGGIRYLKQMEMLVDVAGSVGCKVLFAGAGDTSDDYEEIRSYCEGKSFVSFTGRYSYEEEIAGLYGRVDCVYAVYDADNPNVRIALPNKLYESVICELPIIVAKGTYLGEVVNEWHVGVAVSHNDPKDLEEVMSRMKNDTTYYNDLRRSCVEARRNLSDRNGCIEYIIARKGR